MSKLQVDYLGSNIVITSSTPIFKEFGELQGMEIIFEEMGEVDIIECNEINSNRERMFIDSEQSIFLFGARQEQELIDTGCTVLNKIGDLAEQIDTSNTQHLDFLKWYFSTNDVQEAVQKMYNDCGWVVTNINKFQAYKDLMPNHIENELLLFRENRYRPNIGYDADTKLHQCMYEAEVTNQELEELLKQKNITINNN